MYISTVLLSSWLYSIAAQVTYDKDGLDITSMLGYCIPINTEEVYFDNNLITHVSSGYFQNLPSLDVISLKYNQISDIDDFAFACVSSITKLYLYDNRLSAVRENMFSGLSNLETLSLSRNNIQTIEPGSFKDCSAMTYLILGYNSLQTISECMFSGLHSMDRISLRGNVIETIGKGSFIENPALVNMDLSHNDIHSIEPGSFWNNTALAKLDLDENDLETLPECMFHPQKHPNDLRKMIIERNDLQCNQSLCWLKQLDNDWLYVVDDDYDTPCAGPEALRGRYWSTVTPEELNCGNIVPWENITCGNITENSNCGNIKRENLGCGNITRENISCGITVTGKFDGLRKLLVYIRSPWGFSEAHLPQAYKVCVIV